MAKTICVLHSWEVESLKQNIQPNCADHHHVKRTDAMEMTCRGDFKPYFQPIAEWVGPKHLKLLVTFPIRGLSSKVGAYHAIALRKKRAWAQVMLQNIQLRPSAPQAIEF